MGAGWSEIASLVPDELRPYMLGFEWTHAGLWALRLPVESMAVAELAWQLELRWWRRGERVFAISPAEVLRDPGADREQFERVLAADLAFPVDVTLRRDRWFLLDGVHRLAKATLEGRSVIEVRRVPPSARRLIAA